MNEKALNAAARKIWESESHLLMERAGCATDWENLNAYVKRSVINKARLAVSEYMADLKQMSEFGLETKSHTNDGDPLILAQPANELLHDMDQQIKQLQSKLAEVEKERNDYVSHVNRFKQGVYHFNRSHGDMTLLLEALTETRGTALSDLEQRAETAMARDGLVIDPLGRFRGETNRRMHGALYGVETARHEANVKHFFSVKTQEQDDEEEQPVLLNGQVEQFIVNTVGGHSFFCQCGCNVFHKPDRTDLDVYQCNSCGTRYRADKSQEQDDE